MSESSDIVVIITDQERAAPPYESEALRGWRRRELVAHQWFATNGTEFRRHYAGATACVPSRPTILTGHYPDVHGVTQTTGISKHADDPRMRWLRAGEVPTIGDWFTAGGYDVHYEGKWHVSDADLRDPQTGEVIPTNRGNGDPVPAAVARYLDEQPLSDFGFEGWVGPEPHGARRSNSGMVRDRITADRVVSWLAERNRLRDEGDRSAARPFLLIVSLVNPHDIVFWPAWARNNPLGADRGDPPPIGEAPSQAEDLADKPAIQRAYKRAYPTAYGIAPIVTRLYDKKAHEYRRTYYRLHLEVDRQVERVRRAALAGPRAEATTLLLTSDHGELLGSHGGLHQKWFNLYDETVRVPCFVVTPDRNAAVHDDPTSHTDLLPTLMGLAGLEEASLRTSLEETHTEVHPLPGTDLGSQLGESAGANMSADLGRPIYMITRDNILEGADRTPLAQRSAGRLRQLSPVGIEQPTGVATNLEGIVVRLDPPRGDIWKLVRVFDDPATWSEPEVRNVVRRRFRSDEVRTTQLDDEWELYNLTADPAEEFNLASLAKYGDVLDQLRGELEATRSRMVPPRNSVWPYVSV